MDLETLIVATYCLIDDALITLLAGRRVRQRGPRPTLADSEVLTMEVVGEYLGLDQDTALFADFQRHHADLFPALATMHRTTFVRQAANLWWGKAHIWQALLPTGVASCAGSGIGSTPRLVNSSSATTPSVSGRVLCGT